MDGKRNPAMYGQLPVRLYDAMYSAPTLANNDNPFITSADLTAAINAAVGLNNELSEILGNGNITDGNDIRISTGDKIASVVELTLEATSGMDMYSIAGDFDIESRAADVNILADVNVSITSTTGNVSLIATLGAINIDAIGNVGLTTDGGAFGTASLYLDAAADTFYLFAGTVGTVDAPGGMVISAASGTVNITANELALGQASTILNFANADELVLSGLGLYADDVAAAAGLVAIGSCYVNSGTGAVHRRLA
jgi:hypothetical protein